MNTRKPKGIARSVNRRFPHWIAAKVQLRNERKEHKARKIMVTDTRKSKN
ncbi:MAG: hypothetical protein HOK75_00840 [Phycisphaerae bacterium]|nr:hypothetical protein [Phycisphaerae bacterium]MBT7657652.1 hypothetical protein [Phycisphaerae bacterium]